MHRSQAQGTSGPVMLRDGGVYLLLVYLARELSIRIGALGWGRFPVGWYVYTGSAKRNLSTRIERHMRRHKALHYHIDYLRARCSSVRALPMRSAEVGECELAAAVRRVSDSAIKAFGCSDCGCGSHLSYFRNSPLRYANFRRILALNSS